MNKKGLKIVTIIPARGGSKGLPQKNILPLAGKPLIAYTIEASLQCPLIDRTVVSTDDSKIAEIAKQYGAEVPFFRPKELATGDAPTEDTLKHAVEWLENNEGYYFDILVFMQVTDVFKKRALLEKCIRALLEDESVDSAFVAYPDHKNYWKKVGDKYVRLDKRGHAARQLKEHIYREDTGLGCATRVNIIKQGKRLGDNVVIVPNDDTASFIDIHTEFDFWLAEKIVLEGKKKINE